MAKNLEIPFLLDFYGEMLTEKQRNCLAYYYEEDLSLSEIAENEGIVVKAFEIQSNVQKLSFLIWKKGSVLQNALLK